MTGYLQTLQRAIAEGTGRDYAIYRGGTGYKRSVPSAKTVAAKLARKKTAKTSRRGNR